MAATIKDIAKMVGVSPSTVSRVVNGTAPISEETRAKIREAMRELNYHPNSTARNLASGSSFTIGLVIDAKDEGTFSNSFFNRSVYAIEKVLQENSYSLLITNNRLSQSQQEGKSSIQSLVYEKRVDGLIIPPVSLDEKTAQFLKEQDFPFVVLGEPDVGQKEITWVDVDNKKGSKEAVLHLEQQGFRKIALIVKNKKTVFARNRISGYREGILGVCPGKVICTEENYEEMESEIVRLFCEGKADAFLCSNNEIAYHVLLALHRERIRIPEEAGVVTFDNYPIAPYMDPPLTAVDVDTSELGKVAAQLLIQKIRDSDTAKRQVLIGTRLLPRMSSLRKEGQ